MKKNSLLLLLLILLPFGLSAKLTQTERTRLMNEANELFYQGEYEKAREKYKEVYIEDGDKEADMQIDKVDECKNLIRDALVEEHKGDYDKAIENLEEVLKINPSDKKIPLLIEECKKQKYEPLLTEARQLYREGNYSQAQSLMSRYTAQTNMTDPELLYKLQEAQLLYREANEAYNNKDYKRAKNYYTRLIELNPTDLNANNALTDIDARLKKKTLKEMLKPTKNKFNMFVYSGFSNPVGFGGGIGFNYSYFNLTIDGGGSIEQQGIENDKLYNDKIKYCVKLDDGTYVQGKMQLAISPGVNLKYFIIGVGLGTMMTKELSDTKQNISGDYIAGTQTNGNRFLIRPTITGYIPFDKEFSGGLSVMAGYNIVNGVSGLNQFLLGIGLFF